MLAAQHIHPVIVHFPIVFIITLAVYDLLAKLSGGEITAKTAAGNVSTGLALLSGLSAAIAFYFGGVALDIAEAGGFHNEIAEIHEGLGEFTAAAFALWAAFRVFLWLRDIRLTGVPGFAVPMIEIAGAALVTATAYFGGQLVYELGVNVARVTG